MRKRYCTNPFEVHLEHSIVRMRQYMNKIGFMLSVVPVVSDLQFFGKLKSLTQYRTCAELAIQLNSYLSLCVWNQQQDCASSISNLSKW